MRVAVCDDDAQLRDHYADLTELVAARHGVEVKVDRYEKGEQLLFALSSRNSPPDLVFLDIYMPGKNGIDLGAELRKKKFVGTIIYLTRSKEHMLSAFDVGASNYIIKGKEFEDNRFEKVFLKTAKEIEHRKRKYLLLNGLTDHKNIAIESIRYFEVRKYICVVHYNETDSFEFVSPLSKVENALRMYGFVRSYKSYLINCAAVESYRFKEVTLTDGTVLPLGRKYRPDFVKAMDSHAEVGLGEA